MSSMEKKKKKSLVKLKSETDYVMRCGPYTSSNMSEAHLQAAEVLQAPKLGGAVC